VSRFPQTTAASSDWALRPSTIYLRFAQAYAEGRGWLWAAAIAALFALFLFTHAWWCAGLIAICELFLLRSLSGAACCREELICVLGEEGAR
jgi:hypothetical protein